MSDIRDQAELQRMFEETKKFVAEHDKLVAEGRKLEAERRKLDKESWWFPPVRARGRLWLQLLTVSVSSAAIAAIVARLIH